MLLRKKLLRIWTFKSGNVLLCYDPKGKDTYETR